MTSNRVSGFKPSTSGLHFANRFPREPILGIPLPPFGNIPIGDAARGLCGGMAFTARDLKEAGLAPPPQTDTPAPTSPLYKHLIRRLFDSFDLPKGPIKYYEWMNLADNNTWLARGVAWRTIQEEWPVVKAELDEGKPSPLGLVRVRSANPLHMGQNHQALAYGYDLDETAATLTIYLYDPNHPDQDDVTLSLNLGRPAYAAAITYSTGEPVRGFFHTPYRYEGFVEPIGVPRIA